MEAGPSTHAVTVDVEVKARLRGARRAAAALLLAGLAACGASDVELAETGAAPAAADTTAVSTTTTTTTSTTTSPPSATDTAGDDERQLAFDANITVTDLPTGWNECCRPFFAEPDLLAYNTCEDPAIPASTAGFVREFAYLTDERGAEQGHLVSQVFVSDTEEDAAAKLSCTGTAEYRDEAIAAAEERVVAKSLVEIGPPTSTYEHQHLAVGEQATVDRIQTTYEVVGHGTGWTHQDSIRMRSGRLTYRILIFTYGDALTTEELEQWADLLLARSSAAPR